MERCPFCKSVDITYSISVTTHDEPSMGTQLQSYYFYKTKMTCAVCATEFIMLKGLYDSSKQEEYKQQTFDKWDRRRPCDMMSEDINTYCECCKIRIGFDGMVQRAEGETSQSEAPVPKKKLTAEDFLSGNIVSQKDIQSLEKIQGMIGNKKSLQKLLSGLK